MNLSEYRNRRIILPLETLEAPVSRESSLSKAVIWAQRQDTSFLSGISYQHGNMEGRQGDPALVRMSILLNKYTEIRIVISHATPGTPSMVTYCLPSVTLMLEYLCFRCKGGVKC